MDNQTNSGKFIGVVEVHIHEATDIQNICIYQNQDVYAKFCLTDNTEEKFSSQVVHGGGRNPIFNETLKLPVRTMDSSLRCEVWMLSRIKNYLEDQLLGFALIPLSDVVSKNENEKPGREFELSSSEVFHSPAGFVELSFNYTGKSPDMMETRVTETAAADAHPANNIVSCELDRIVFPDQEIVNQNECMVSEYLRSLENDDNNNSPSVTSTDFISQEKAGADDQGENVVVATTVFSPSDVGFTKSEDVSIHKGDSSVQDGGVVVPKAEQAEAAVSPQKVVDQEEIIDMYMKGMQQFTDALDKMKLLPVDHNTKLPQDHSDSDRKGQTSNSTADDADPSTRVFYGSTAFF